MKKIILYLLVLFFVSGCAIPHSKKLSDADRFKLNLIQVGSIKREPLMHYSGPLSIRSAGAFFLEAIGEFGNRATFIHPATQFAGIPFTVAAGALRHAELIEFQTLIENKNNISIQQIILDEIITQLQRTGKIQFVGSHNEHLSSATLNITIPRHGFSNVFFTPNLVPELSVVASLTDKDGKIIWQYRSDYSKNTDSVTATPMDEFKLRPELIKESWHAASKIVIANIVSDLMNQLKLPQSSNQ